MTRNDRFPRNAAVSLCAIGILYFAVVAAIGDPAPPFAAVPEDTASFGTDPADTGAHPTIDGVKNAEAVTAVLFPDKEEPWTAPAQIEPAPEDTLFTELTSFDTETSEIPLMPLDTQGIAAALNIEAGNARSATGRSGFGVPGRGESAKGIPSAGFGGFAARPATQGDSTAPTANGNSSPLPANSSPLPGKSLNKPAAQGVNNDEDYSPVQIAAVELPPAQAQTTDPSGNDDNDFPRNPEVNAVAVPEPASLLLLLLGMSALSARRLRRADGAVGN